MLWGLKNVNIVQNDRIIKGNILIENGYIKAINQDLFFQGVSFKDEVIVTPGFIDTHIHGINDSNVMDGTIISLRDIANALPHDGTTSFLATTMTASTKKLEKVLANVKEYINNDDNLGARLLGVHMEGPFICSDYCGAQDKSEIILPDVAVLKKLQEASGHSIRIVTLAPELQNAGDLIEYCKNNQIIASIGHSSGKYLDVVKAIRHGAQAVTHMFNAMSPLHHRELGVAGSALLLKELHVELIPDGVHVSKEAIELIYKNKGIENITLITDRVGVNTNVYVTDNVVRINNKLVGTTIGMITGMKNMMQYLDLSLIDVVQMATVNPAKRLGIYNKVGSIEVGKMADLVVLDKDYNIVMTIIEGNKVYENIDI